MLVELEQEEGRFSGTPLHFVAKILHIREDRIKLSFLRKQSVFVNNMFRFPDVEDISTINRTASKGVLVTSRGATRRQEKIIRVVPPLDGFNMR